MPWRAEYWHVLCYAFCPDGDPKQLGLRRDVCGDWRGWCMSECPEVLGYYAEGKLVETGYRGSFLAFRDRR